MMLKDVENALQRCGPGLWRDALGLFAMTVIFVGALHLPALA